MDALLFRLPAGIVEASRLLTISTSQFNGGTRGLSSYPDFLSLQAGVPAFQSIAAFDDGIIEDVQLVERDDRHRARD
jgi:hypothetical protein